MTTPTTALDVRMPDVRIEFGLARAEVALRSATRAHAEQLAAIDATLREAREFPEVFVGPFGTGADAVDFAERAAVADLAVRLGLAEQTVRAQAHEASTLIERTPRVWLGFREGDVSVPNARTVAELAASLRPESWAAFDEIVLAAASTLAPARFRAKARVLRERVEARTLTERHEVRAQQRRVALEPDIDGMGWFSAYVPMHEGRRMLARLDAAALAQAGDAGETRTFAQLRADVLVRLVAGELGQPGSVGVRVSVTVPVLTLLGRDEPASLDGLVPIDAQTARELARHAPSFTRILTHPISSTVLDVDRTSYRVPADLARWLRIRDGEACTFPGCGRRAAVCDIDHIIAWEHDGRTQAENLGHLCRHHHRLKHKTRWHVERSDGTTRWTSPTGNTRSNDPPPF